MEEGREDRTISVGDLLDYASVLDLEMSVVFLPRKTKIVDRVTMHAHEMLRLLQKLVKLSEGDHDLEKGVDRFHDECWQSLNRMVGYSNQTIRSSAKKRINRHRPGPVTRMKTYG